LFQVNAIYCQTSGHQSI